MLRVFLLSTLLPVLLLTACKENQEAQSPEIQVVVERLAASKAKTPADIQPYDEALTWHEYRVKRVLNGKLTAPIIRVAHWSVVAARAAAIGNTVGETATLKIVPFESLKGLDDVVAVDDLDVTSEAPRFLDLSQSLTQENTPTAVRYDYRGNISNQMRLYWPLRSQLRIVVMGNSHGANGICPPEILDAADLAVPTMLNLCPAGSNNRMQCLMLREYVLPLPKLEWVIWVVSARSFNAKRRDEQRYNEFTTSPGWMHDQKHKSELWPVPAVPQPLTAAELAKQATSRADLLGCQAREGTELPQDPAKLRALILDQCSSTRYAWSEEIFAHFRNTIELLAKKGVKVLLLTTPIHPLVREAHGCDPDGTTHEGFHEMVRRMEALDQATPGVWFRDFNRDGAHEFPTEEFHDVDHLNRAGAARLAKHLRPWMAQCAAEGSAQ